LTVGGCVRSPSEKTDFPKKGNLIKSLPAAPNTRGKRGVGRNFLLTIWRKGRQGKRKQDPLESAFTKKGGGEKKKEQAHSKSGSMVLHPCHYGNWFEEAGEGKEKKILRYLITDLWSNSRSGGEGKKGGERDCLGHDFWWTEISVRL